MALASQMSDKGLARFRTKRCERLLAKGICSFDDKCQYSHDKDWLRRNPLKVQYIAKLCPKVSSGGPSACPKGQECPFAHSKEEVFFHPKVYKATLCSGGDACGGYYCPFAHGFTELREPDEMQPENFSSQMSTRAFTEESGDTVGNGSGSEGDAWEKFDECLRIDRVAMDACSSSSRTSYRGRTLGGQLRDKSGAWNFCRVHMASSGRNERDQAAQVVRELRKWMGLEPLSAELRDCRALAIRRTVATVCVALPEVLETYLEDCSPCCAAGGIGEASAAAPLRSLIGELKQLHSAGISHTCLTPSSVFVRGDDKGKMLPTSKLLLGDFLSKIQNLSIISSKAAQKELIDTDAFQEWAMWQPSEVQKLVISADPSEAGELDWFKVDSWQLGVTASFLLIGEHLFGPRDQPHTVCSNIARGNAVNLPKLLRAAPKLGRLIGSLVALKPGKRPEVQHLLEHSALPGLSAVKATATCVGDEGRVKTISPPPGLPAPVGQRTWMPPSVDPAEHLVFSEPGTSEQPDSSPEERRAKSNTWSEIVRTPLDSDKAATCPLETSLRVGTLLRCIWEGGVRFRARRDRSTRTSHRLEHGDQVSVLEHAVGWVRGHHGWLPLHGIDDAFGVPLFEVVQPVEKAIPDEVLAPSEQLGLVQESRSYLQPQKISVLDSLLVSESSFAQCLHHGHLQTLEAQPWQQYHMSTHLQNMNLDYFFQKGFDDAAAAASIGSTHCLSSWPQGIADNFNMTAGLSSAWAQDASHLKDRAVFEYQQITEHALHWAPELQDPHQNSVPDYFPVQNFADASSEASTCSFLACSPSTSEKGPRPAKVSMPEDASSASSRLTECDLESCQESLFHNPPSNTLLYGQAAASADALQGRFLW
eukprot:TRINITY_DN22341_c0_g1_i4.p1 TRINITY_DN22341_c0_g1~~TRINITY_DN22341_c0_g1_i4.p1  ORF type:complete len:875 (-),score=181.68 TRINITY_DN22341_c0_g1_i4:74-2698(-)